MNRPAAEHVAAIHQDGFTVVRGAISSAYARTLHEAIERAFTEPEDGYGAILRVKMFERDQAFEPLIDNAPVVDVVERILGDNCHLIAMSAIKTPKGTGIANWHVDEELILPLPEGVELDPRVQTPIVILTCIYYLVDVDETMGPTQFIPGSQRSGSHPPKGGDYPDYKGRAPVTVLAKAGDCLIFNGQAWHRGATNQSDRPRVVQQAIYGRRWVSQRFYPFVNYQLPEGVIERANPRRRRLLGLHKRGPYG